MSLTADQCIILSRLNHIKVCLNHVRVELTSKEQILKEVEVEVNKLTIKARMPVECFRCKCFLNVNEGYEEDGIFYCNDCYKIINNKGVL